MSEQFANPAAVMQRALELARRGEGHVEPNPLVGAVVVDAALNFISEGWHEAFGGPHAEIHALRSAGERARGATLFVTLEPCCHQGKTPPCADAVIAAGISRVVIGAQDPNPQVADGGIAALRAAGIDVEVGVQGDEASRLIAPFSKLVTTGRPYMLAKWAMSLDGKIVSPPGAPRWISNKTSQARVHQLRGRMDAIIVGSGTARADDPLLTARPPGPRTLVRIVVDSRAQLAIESQLVRTLDQGPVIVATCASPQDAAVRRLVEAGVEVLHLAPYYSSSGWQSSHAPLVNLPALMDELGKRQMTNVLVEGGSTLLAALFAARLVDEAHVFIAPKVFGRQSSLMAVAGSPSTKFTRPCQIASPQIEVLDGDVYIHGPLRRRHVNGRNGIVALRLTGCSPRGWLPSP